MKVLVISDVHANFEALLAVEKLIPQNGIDEIWFLGDLPDRGPDPIMALQWLNDHVKIENWLLGNHDAYLLNLATKADLDGVNEKVIETSSRQRSELFSSSVVLDNWKQAHQSTIVKKSGDVAYFLTHGSPSDPVGHNRSIYGWSTSALLNNEFHKLENKMSSTMHKAVCFVGHTHIPTLIGVKNGSQQLTYQPIQIDYGKAYDLNASDHWFINPGSVGSPRDMDHRAACAVLDTSRHMIVFHRLLYDVEKTALKLLNRGYDTVWADRLFDAEPPRETPEAWIEFFKNQQI